MMQQEYKTGEIVIVREDIPVSEVPPEMGKFIGEEVEVQYTDVMKTHQRGQAVYMVAHSTGQKFYAVHEALRRRKQPGQDDGMSTGSWDIIQQYTGWKAPVPVSV